MVAPATNLVITPHSKVITISWTDSVTPNVQYQVYRSPCGPSGPFVAISNRLTDTVFVDYTVTPGAYYYRVRTYIMNESEYADTRVVLAQFSGPRPYNDDTDASGSTEAKGAVTVATGKQVQGSSETERILRLKGKALLC